MIYGSVCSGIEAASVAWHPLGWRPAFFSEIEPFPRAVLQHRWPGVPVHGDFTTIQSNQYAAIDVLVGGTPCQSFSVAGLRKGLDDERGNLALEFCRLAQRLGPRWVVWENVPGVLSLDGGRAFASILGGLAECGYGLAYRVLDAQFVRIDGFGRAVPQRRRRVFVVGCLGSWQRAAAVLFERESLCGHSPPRREAGKDVARPIGAGVAGSSGYRNDADTAENLIHFQGRGTNLEFGRDVAGTLGTTIDRASGSAPCVAHTLNAKGGAGRTDAESETLIPCTRSGGGEDGTGRGTPIVPIAFDETQITSADNRCNPQPGDPCHPLVKAGRPPTLAFNWNAQPDQMNFSDKTTPTLSCSQGAAALLGWRVRRLMPVECERLQGFPEITKSVTVSVWPSIDQAENAARAASLSLKSQRSASNAEGNGSARSASSAGGHSSIGHQSHVPRVAVTVRINYERQQVAVLRTGRLIWSASIAEKPGASPLLMPVADFVQLVANMLIRLDPTTHAGVAESRANINASSDRLNGSASVHLSGGEIAADAGDAERFTTGVTACMKFTTSGVGRNFPISEPIWRTWCSCVTRAIGSCIPDEIRAASSFDVSIELTHGYTAIPYRGKPAPDSPRYRALGNSMAVNCMRWIGRRIEMVDAIEEAGAERKRA